jgi:hypothetical protein
LGQRSEKPGHAFFVACLGGPESCGCAVAQDEAPGLGRVLRGKGQIVRANGGHVGLLSPRADIFKADLVWNEPALARMLHRRLIEDRASPASGNGPLRFFFSLNFEPGP